MAPRIGQEFTQVKSSQVKSSPGQEFAGQEFARSRVRSARSQPKLSDSVCTIHVSRQKHQICKSCTCMTGKQMKGKGKQLSKEVYLSLAKLLQDSNPLACMSVNFPYLSQLLLQSDGISMLLKWDGKVFLAPNYDSSG